MVFIALIASSLIIFSLCGTILNERESGKMKKLDLMQDPMHYTLPNFVLVEGSVLMS